MNNESRGAKRWRVLGWLSGRLVAATGRSISTVSNRLPVDPTIAGSSSPSHHASLACATNVRACIAGEAESGDDLEEKSQPIVGSTVR